MGILDDAIREHLELKRSHGADEDELRRKEAEVFGAARQEAAPAAHADEHTQVISSETHVAEPAAADVDTLQPAPEDPYEVHPGDTAVPDPGAQHRVHAEPAEQAAPPVEEYFDTEHAAEAGAGMLEPHKVEPGPPSPPEHHHRPPTDEHPALVDHDRFHHEEHPPEPVFRAAEEDRVAPADAPLEPSPIDDPPVGDPPVVRPDVDEPPPRQSPETGAHHDVDEIDGPAEDVLEDTPEFLQDAPEHDRLWFEQKPPRDFDFGE